MSFKARLEVGNEKFIILDCSYALYQETDATGRPSSVTRGGTINFSTESTDKTFLSDWMFNNFERKDGKVIFLKRDTDATSKTLEFTEAYMISYSESFSGTGGMPMIETFTISALSIKLGTGEHINEWV
ncbi:MAG: hypothetical protein ACI840_000442 [Ulvibacter sp.]|jgi:hypothetical protein